MNPGIRLRLSVMMFLEFFIWGAWAVTIAIYLGKIGFPDEITGAIGSATAWAAIVSPLFVGLVADRFFNAERVLGVLHLMGGVLLFVVSGITDPNVFFWVLLAYALTYMPTIALVNTVAFHQMTSPEKQFPGVRVLGTIGWIVAGWVVGTIQLAPGALQIIWNETTIPLIGSATEWTTIEATAVQLQVAGAASLLLGVFSFLLPRTPPRQRGTRASVADMLGLRTIGLMRDRSFAVFAISSFLVCIPLAFYYIWTGAFLDEQGLKTVAARMSFGQMSEIVFMLLMPFFFVRLGVKKMLLIGMLSWTVRYLLFAFGNGESLVWMYYLGIILHGICYDFFFVTGQIYVDNKAPAELKASAQGFFALITYGLGMAIGGSVSGLIVGAYATEGTDTGHNWTMIWIIPAVTAAAVALLFALTFRDEKLTAAPGENTT